ncbi:hypothetical protein RUM43_006463, partial [Polyplax serrata]
SERKKNMQANREWECEEKNVELGSAKRFVESQMKLENWNCNEESGNIYFPIRSKWQNVEKSLRWELEYL